MKYTLADARITGARIAIGYKGVFVLSGRFEEICFYVSTPEGVSKPTGKISFRIVK